MRIAHFIETDLPGGAEKLLLNLCEHQKAIGLIPVIAHFDHPYFRQYCEANGIEQIIVPKKWFKKGYALPVFAITFGQQLKKSNIDVLHCHLFGPIVGGALAAFVSGIPGVGTLHDIHMVEDVPGRRWMLQLASFVGMQLVCVCEAMRDFYRARLSRWGANLRTIYNGIDVGKYEKVDANSVRRELSIDASELVVVTTGRLVGLKKIETLLRAIAALPAEKRPLTLIVGEGPEESMLKSLATQQGITDRVRFLGYRSDVLKILQAADIYVQCSETEGLSVSILEAAATGLPCVVTAVGGNGEIVEHDKNGYVFAVENHAALAEHLGALLGNRELRARMSAQAIALTKERFSALTCYEKYVGLYQELSKSAKAT